MTWLFAGGAWLADFLLNTRFGKIAAGGALVAALFFAWLTGHDAKTTASAETHPTPDADGRSLPWDRCD